MDNNELDKIIKQKLKGKIQMPLDMEGKIRQQIEQEKAKKLKEIDINKEKTKSKKYTKLKPIISIAAMLVIVFTLGVFLKNNPDSLNIFNTEQETVAVTITSIEPTKASNGILANDTEFIIYTDGQKASKEDVQKSLYIEPALDYTIEKINNEQYKLKFEQNIPDNTIVKLQYIKNKVAENSWAYQTSNKLTVTSTYPSNGAETVSSKTSIEIKFSYANIEEIEENITITPKIKGKWEHKGNIWRFTPNKELEEEQKYSITIKKGLKAGKEALENNYKFEFTVNSEEEYPKYTYSTNSIDKINTFKPDEQIKIYYKTDDYSSSDVEIGKVEISKFNSTDEFIEYLETGSYEKAEKEGKYNFNLEPKYIQLNKTLTKGYYVASVQTQKGTEIFNCPIQINDLAGYAVVAERDVLIWVANGESLAKDISVKYLDKEQKTNEQGIAEFKDIADDSQTIKYVEAGNDENKLIVGIYNYDLDNYPSGYLYTDRPLYKNTDTVNIWGFVPRELFYDKIEDEFYIEFGEEGKQKVKVDEEGNINYQVDLKNHVDNEYLTIALYYKDTPIAERQITIENYELQNYTYEVIKDKNYVENGENYEFEVQVKHITGLYVPNKTVAVEYDEEIYKETTDENGIAKFSIKMKEDDDNSTIVGYGEIAIYNGDAEEYTTAEEYFDVSIINRSAYTEIEEPERNKYELTLYNLDTTKNTDVSYDLNEIYNGVYDTDIQINLVETVYERYISDYEYNEYTKENEPIYSTQEIDKNTEEVQTISTQNGKIEFDANNLQLKQDTEENTYSYDIQFKYKDSDGKDVVETCYIYNGDQEETNLIGYAYEGTESSGDMIYEANAGIDIDSYYTYRYFFERDREEFKIGDTVNLTLSESTEDGTKQIQNQGKVLRIVLKENITKTDIIEDNSFSYTFEESDFPGCKITSAYFYNGKFYRMPSYYFDFDEQDRKVDIEITSDKQEYKPGDEVTLKVKTTNNGNAIKSSVNISVVNKAVFELEEDETNIVENIYQNKNYPLYTYSTFRDDISKTTGRRRRWRRRAKRRFRRYRLL